MGSALDYLAGVIALINADILAKGSEQSRNPSGHSLGLTPAESGDPTLRLR